MPLSPLTPDSPNITIVEPTIQPLRTYGFNFDTGRFTGGKIDNTVAVNQMIQKALDTPRFRFLIYSTDYGCEYESLIGSEYTGAFLESEMIRFTKDALLHIYDNIIQDCTDFVFEHIGDETYMSFKAVTDQGILDQIIRLNL